MASRIKRLNMLKDNGKFEYYKYWTKVERVRAITGLFLIKINLQQFADRDY